MTNIAPTGLGFDWVPASISFLWRDRWLECALRPGETCIESALKAISENSNCNLVEAYSHGENGGDQASGHVWKRFVVGLCWDDLLESDDVGELRIPLTPSSAAIDMTAEMLRDLISEAPKATPANYFILSRNSDGRFDIVQHFIEYDFGADGYPT